MATPLGMIANVALLSSDLNALPKKDGLNSR
jgi:hypothetical protein